jgi:drug/metabolite transporter (DMT)-like permease
MTEAVLTGKRAGDPARLALGALVLGALVIGISGTLVKLTETGPVALGFYRVALGIPLMAAMSWAAETRRPAPRSFWADLRANAAVLALGGAAFAGDLATWHWALGMTSVANATLIGNMAPIWVTLGAWLLFKQRVSRLFVAGMAITFTGAVVLMSRSLELSTENMLGDALCVLTSLFYGIYFLVIAHARARLSTPTVMAATCLAAAALLLPLSAAVGETILPSTLFGWGIVFAMALVVHTGGQGLVTFAFAHLPAGFTALSLLIQPVAAAIFAWIILGEAIGPVQAAGGVIVIAGILVARRASRPRP